LVNGELVDICEDHWIPRPLSLKVVTSKGNNATPFKVDDLIHRDLGTWPESPIHKLMLIMVIW